MKKEVHITKKGKLLNKRPKKQKPLPPIKMEDLLNAGYTYKMDVLTNEERDEWTNGGKWVDPKTNQEVRVPSQDFDYFFKVLPGDVEVKIFHVIQQFYYQGVRLQYAGQLEQVEKSAKESKHWDDLLSTIPDDEPTEVVLPESLKTGQAIITLKGGPLDGKQRAYLTMLTFYAEVVDRKVISGRVVSKVARYIKDQEDNTIFHFKETI